MAKGQNRRVWDESSKSMELQKVWRQLNDEDIVVARCTVRRLMKEMGLQGVQRGKKPKMTISSSFLYPQDLVHATFKRQHPIVYGLQISPMFRPSPVLSMSSMSRMFFRGELWAGTSRRPCTRISL